MGTASYDAEVRHDGRLHSFTVPQLHLPICRACGEKVFTEQVDDQIGAALRAHLHLLTPAEMRAGLERLTMTQKEAAERLGIAEATLSRWLTNTQIQSRALDNLLRVFFTIPQVREALGGSQERQPKLQGCQLQDRNSGPVNRIKTKCRYSSPEDEAGYAATGNGLHLFSRN